MTRTLALALPLFVSCSVGSCQQDAEEVMSLSTHLYRVVGTETLRLDLRQPAHPRQDCPGLIFVHGGAFQRGSRDTPTASQFLDSLAQAGIASASISYRLTMAGRGFGCNIPTEDKRGAVAAAGTDALAALVGRVQRPLTSHSTGWVIAGSSAGAETALWSGYVDAPDRWKGVTSYSGALDAATRPSWPLLLVCPPGGVMCWSPSGRTLSLLPEDETDLALMVVPRGWTLSAPQTDCGPGPMGGGHGVCTSHAQSGCAAAAHRMARRGAAQNRDVCVDQDGSTLPGGRTSCPHPCN